MSQEIYTIKEVYIPFNNFDFKTDRQWSKLHSSSFLKRNSKFPNDCIFVNKCFSTYLFLLGTTMSFCFCLFAILFSCELDLKKVLYRNVVPINCWWTYLLKLKCWIHRYSDLQGRAIVLINPTTTTAILPTSN